MLIEARNGFAVGNRLPYDAEVEYLESTGTQWIDTGVVGGSDTRWVVDCAITDNRSVNRYMGQVATAPTYNARLNFGRNLNNNFTGFIGSQSSIMLGVLSDSDRHIFVLDAVLGVFRVDSRVLNFSGVTWYYPSQPRGGISLFGRRFIDTGDTNPIISMRVWSSQIYQSGVLVRDMIPVRFTNENSQTEGAMYDRLGTGGMNPDGSARTDGLYRNRGTGVFGYGNDKSAANRGGGYKRKCVRRSYRRSLRPSHAFWHTPLWKEVA